MIFSKWRKRVHAGTILGVVAALYIAVYLIQTTHQNYGLNQKIGILQGQIQELENEQEKLKYQIQYYQTDAYKERQARAKLGLQAPGEGVVIVPHDSSKDDTKKVEEKPKKSNFEQWKDFLSGKY